MYCIINSTKLYFLKIFCETLKLLNTFPHYASIDKPVRSGSRRFQSYLFLYTYSNESPSVFIRYGEKNFVVVNTCKSFTLRIVVYEAFFFLPRCLYYQVSSIITYRE